MYKGGAIMATVTMRIDDKMKTELQEFLSDLGMDMTTFFNICSRQALREQRIPFEIRRETPNVETLEAFQEVEQMKQHPERTKTYTDVDKMMEELLQ